MRISDYFGLWENDRRSDPARRSLEQEKAFWHGHAAVYDQHAGLTCSSLAQIGTVTSIVEPESSILDVGGGTGRFAIPLAQRGCRVTVVDRSEDMLRVLSENAEAEEVKIETIQGQWPMDTGRVFDTVLAAWSLYWALDLAASLRALVRQARRHVIIIDTTGSPTAWDHALAAAQGEDVRVSQARHLLLAGGLAQLGIPAEIRILEEYRVVSEDELYHEVQTRVGNFSEAIRIMDSYAIGFPRGWRCRRTIGLVHVDAKGLVGALPDMPV